MTEPLLSSVSQLRRATALIRSGEPSKYLVATPLLE